MNYSRHFILRSLNKIALPFFVSLAYLFLYIPIAVLVIFSFNSESFPAPWLSFSLKWYTELFQTPIIWDAFYNSLIVAASSTFLSLFISLILVYYNVMGHKLDWLLYIFYSNIIIPEIVLAVGLLSFLTFLYIPLGLLTLIVGHTTLGLGYVIPIVYIRYLSIDPRVVEASLDLGATAGQTFFKIILPLLSSSLVAAGLLVFMISFDDFVISFFCAGSESQTLSLYIYSMLRSGVSPVVNALSTILLAFSSLVVLIFCSLNVKTKIF